MSGRGRRIRDLSANDAGKMFGIVLIIAAGLICYFKSVLIEPKEEFGLEYVCSDDPYASPEVFGEPVECIGDVLTSHYNMYMTTNGRAPVHVLLSLFVNFIGLDLFYLLNAVIFMIVIRLTVGYIADNGRQAPMWLYVAVLTGLLYFTPDQDILWFAPAFAINYLWTLLATLLYLSLWRRSCRFSTSEAAVWIPAAFICGWTNEAFAVPVGGMMGLYLLRHFKGMFKGRSVIALSYLAGTAFLVFAPGNFYRLESQTSETVGLASLVINTLWNCRHAVLMIVLAVLTGWRFFREKDGVIKFVKDNGFDFGLAGFSLLFILMLAGGGRGVISCDFFSLVLLCRFACRFCPFVRRRAAAVLAVAVFAVIVVHQVLIIDELKRQKESFEAMIGRYLASEDGTVVYDVPQVGSVVVSPWVTPWDLPLASEEPFDYLIRGIVSRHYGHPGGPSVYLQILPSADSEALAGLFTPDNLVAGTAGVYTTSALSYYWKPAEIADTVPSLVYRFDPDDMSGVPFKKRIKFMVLGPENEEPVEHIRKVTIGGNSYMVLAKNSRNVIAIDSVSP